MHYSIYVYRYTIIHTYIHIKLWIPVVVFQEARTAQRVVVATFLSSPNSKRERLWEKRTQAQCCGSRWQHILEKRPGNLCSSSSSHILSCFSGANAVWELRRIAWSIGSHWFSRCTFGSWPEFWRWYLQLQLPDSDSRYGSMSASHLLSALWFTIPVWTFKCPLLICSRRKDEVSINSILPFTRAKRTLSLFPFLL